MKILGVHNIEPKENLLLNGDMKISQRGTYTSLADYSYQYHLDRWYDTWSGHGNVQTQQVLVNQPSEISGSKSWKQVVQLTAGAGTVNGLWQKVEDYLSLSGKTLTFSCYVKSNTDTPPVLRLEDGVSTFTSTPYNNGILGQWQRLVVTATISNSPTQLRCYIVCSGAVTIGQYMEMTGAKLEIGNVASPFISRSSAEEFALCQRYYTSLGGTNIQAYGSSSARALAIYRSLPVTMRTTPDTTATVVTYQENTTNAAVSASTSTVLFTATPAVAGWVRAYFNPVILDSEM